MGPSGSKQNVMPSKGYECEGVLGNGHKCQLSRNGLGEPIRLNSCCKKCKEWRCKAHCRCARNDELSGRNRARSKDPARPTGPAVVPRATLERLAVEPSAVSSVRAPMGRPASLQVKVLPRASWWPKLLQDVAAASRVVVAAYLYDNTNLHNLFMEKLQSRQAFDLQVTVDKEAVERDASRQRRKLLALKVGIASGTSTIGRLHCKALMLDRRVVCTGSANLIDKSESNYRLQEPLVQAVSEAVASFCTRAVFIYHVCDEKKQRVEHRNVVGIMPH